MEATCTRCDHATWIVWDAKPWCREHDAQAESAAASVAEDAGSTT